MTLAIRIEEFLQARQQRDAARTAARAARDAFVQAQFPLLNARLEDLLRSAAGTHSRLSVDTTAQVLAVAGRTFNTLPQTIVTVAATLDTQTLGMRFEPVLDARTVDQFGRVQCTIDFERTLRRSRAGAIARALLTDGIQMRGSTSSHLLIAPAGAWVELTASDLEVALAELMLQ